MQVQDSRYDAYYDLIWYQDNGPWSTRFTAWCIPGLLYRNQADDVQNAIASIEGALSTQMTDYESACTALVQTVEEFSRLLDDQLIPRIETSLSVLVFEYIDEETTAALKAKGWWEGSRSVNKTIYEDLEMHQYRVASSWLSVGVMIGGQTLNEMVNGGDQFIPAIVQWASDPESYTLPV
ncbi:putative Linalool dehydratase/isomerase domain-containing protein [Seiridium cardinale]|uniref:Linalool dehydratase/isomerase domain-containing protein n=1 Tax=Seiridium cardinale TaxID=138064 RepID=A0ABR2Y9H3_9PEZI